ncbi:MAG: hypothetical protein OXU31_09410, partial [Gammaproteobacteria bacterium]|nr:hypothetical protein [Gammaproteobacteria bacterium]
VEYSTGDNTDSVMVTDNDPINTVTVADAAAVQELRSTTFTVTIDQASAGIVEVAWTASIGGTMGGTPEPASGTLSIPAGDTTGDISIRIPLNQELNDGDTRTLTVTLGAVTINAPGGGTVTTSDTATATVNYVTAAHTVSIAAAEASIAEGGTAMFTATRTDDQDLTTQILITWTVGDASTGGDVEEADFGGTFPTGSVTFSGSETTKTFSVRPTDDNLAEMMESFAVTLSATDAVLQSNDIVALGDPATVTITDNDNIAITLGGPRNINEERTFRFPVRLSTTPTAALTLDWAVTAGTSASLSSMCTDPGSDIVAAVPGDFADSAGAARTSFPTGMIEIAAGERVEDIVLHTSDGGGEDTCRREFILTLSMVAGGGGTDTPVAPMAVTITITEDDPAARARVVATPLVRVAQGVGQLATAAIGERISFVGGNVLSVAGRQVSALSETQKAAASGAWAASPFERARVLAASSGGGSGVTAKELLEQSSFALSLGGSGLNLWGSGGRMSAKGDDNNVSYDGDSTAWHFGADTPWRDGLLGVAVSQTSSETDFTPAGEAQQKLDTDVTSVHPYMSRNLSDKTRLWAAFGYGVGDADLVEEGVTLKSDLTVLGLGAGLTMNPVEGIQLRLGGQWSRAELDGANSGGKELRAVNASALRLNVGMEAGIEVGDARPFVTLRIRHDSGDGDEGSAADYGAGVEWQRDAMHVRVEGSGHLQGDAADEESLSITVRRQAAANAAGLAPYARWNISTAAAGAKMRMHNGRLSLGMEVGVDDNTMRLGNLFTGEWRF